MRFPLHLQWEDPQGVLPGKLFTRALVLNPCWQFRSVVKVKDDAEYVSPPRQAPKRQLGELWTRMSNKNWCSRYFARTLIWLKFCSMYLLIILLYSNNLPNLSFVLRTQLRGQADMYCSKWEVGGAEDLLGKGVHLRQHPAVHGRWRWEGLRRDILQEKDF